jgi:hypothetical protein
MTYFVIFFFCFGYSFNILIVLIACENNDIFSNFFVVVVVAIETIENISKTKRSYIIS